MLKAPALAAAALLAAAAGAALLATSATTAAPAPTAAPAASAAAYNVDGVHSSVMFHVRHMNVANFWGAFRDVSGSFTLEDGGPIHISIKPESVDSRNERRDAHLRNQDFFSVKEFPVLEFKAGSMKKTGEDTFEAAGELTLRGVTKPLTVTIERTGQAEGRNGPIVGIETRFTIKRSDFGMTYGLGNALGDEVHVIACLEGVQR